MAAAKSNKKKSENVNIETENTSENISDNISIEESFEELEEIISSLSEEEISLAKSFELYSKGMNLVKKCSTELEEVEKKVLALSDDAEVTEFE